MPHSLPRRPSVEQLRKQAKDILKAHHAGDASAAETLRHLPRFAGASDAALLAAQVTLNDVQHALALFYGFENWAALKKHIDDQPASDKGRVMREDGKVWIEEVPELRWGKSGECTFAGALSAALSVTSRPVTYADLMGWSGLAFRVRWFRRFDQPDWCPSSPVGEFSEEILTTAKAIGWEVAQESRMGENQPDMSHCAPAMRQSIEAGCPIVGYPDSDLNAAVAYGCEEADGRTTFLWNAYGRTALRVPAGKVGPWQMFLRAQGAPMKARDAVVQALTTPNWRRRRLPPWRKTAGDAAYLYGQDALRTWREDIEQAETFPEEGRKKLFFVSWWCFDCLVDARMAAARFLRGHANDLEPEARPALLSAAETYERTAEFCAEECFRKHNAFLGPWTGKKFEDWTADVRSRECDVLARVAEFDEDAVRRLDTVLRESAAAD